MFRQLQQWVPSARGMSFRAAVGLCAFAVMLSGVALPLHTLLEHGDAAQAGHARHAHGAHAHGGHAHSCADDHGHTHDGHHSDDQPEKHDDTDDCPVCQQLLAGNGAILLSSVSVIATAPAVLAFGAAATPVTTTHLRLAHGRAPPAA